MNIRKSILLSYLILVFLVIIYSFILVFFNTIQKRIDMYALNLSQTKDIWNELLISMNDLQINWDDGNTFVKFREKAKRLDNSLYNLAVHKPFRIRFLNYSFGKREMALYNTWSIARVSTSEIIRLIENPDFQRVVSILEKSPGLQRLNHFVNNLYYKSDNDGNKDAYVVEQVIDIIEFFPIYSETINRLFNITINETNSITDRLDKLQSKISVVFFLLFLVLYMIFALRFTGKISEPIINLSIRLSSFMGKALQLESYSHTNELNLLSMSVNNLIEHYTYLSKLAEQLAVGDLNSPLLELPKQGIVGDALKAINSYLKELAETSQLIRDGNYGAEVTVKSGKDILAINFNIMSKVILEKITTLSNMFEAVEESILVIDYDGNLLEANNKLLQLLGMNSGIADISSIGKFHDFIKDDKVIRRIYGGNTAEGLYTQMINLEGESFPVKIIPKSMPIVRSQSNKVMLFITNESIRVRTEREKEKLKAQAVEAELRALRAQINPHFLFNTLNAIVHLVESGSKEAVVMIEKLAELFRYSLASTRRNTVQISEEIEVIKKFLDIEKMRFGDSLTVEYSIDKDLILYSIPPMLIQPVVENAVKYGVDENGEIFINISITRRDKNIIVCVSDRGSQVINHQLLFNKHGTGIKNVNRRLQSLYNNQLQFFQNSPRGLKVIMEIPEN